MRIYESVNGHVVAHGDLVMGKRGTAYEPQVGMWCGGVRQCGTTGLTQGFVLWEHLAVSWVELDWLAPEGAGVWRITR